MGRSGIVWLQRYFRGRPPQLARNLVCISYLIVAALTISWAFAGWSYDDPFITYRYAANLVHGLGFVYNTGERVLSTTTPLFAMMLALCAVVSANLPHMAELIGAISLVAAAYCLWDMSYVLGHPLVGWIALLLYPTFSLLLNTLGSEMPFYLAVCVAAFACNARRRYAYSACFAALATLTRPDGVLVLAVLAGYHLLSRKIDVGRFTKARVLFWRPALIYISITAVWFLFAWAYFGTLLPATLAAKQAQVMMPASQGYLAGLNTILMQYLPGSIWLAIGFALIGLIYGDVRRNPLLLISAWAALFFTGYATIGVSRYFWYYAPLAPGFIIAAGLGIEAVSTLFLRGARRILAVRMCKGLVGIRVWPTGHVGKSHTQTTLGAGRVSIVVSACCASVILLGQLGRDIELMKTGDDRIGIYRAAGEWLQAYTDPDSTVAALEIGVIGYYSQRTIIDFAGLIQPAVARQLAIAGTYEDTAIWVMDHYNPDFLVLRENTFPRLEQALVLKQCVSVQTFPGVRYGYDANVQIYRCHPA